MFFLATLAHAADAPHIVLAKSFVSKFNDVILFPLISLLLALALLLFIYGVFEYIAGSADESKRSIGRMHMVWGIVGMIIMVSAYGIISLALATFGASLPQ